MIFNLEKENTLINDNQCDQFYGIINYKKHFSYRGCNYFIKDYRHWDRVL